eukprot:4187551-Pyramimonas_sp.AAC.2
MDFMDCCECVEEACDRAGELAGGARVGRVGTGAAAELVGWDGGTAARMGREGGGHEVAWRMGPEGGGREVAWRTGREGGGREEETVRLEGGNWCCFVEGSLVLVGVDAQLGDG